MRNMPKLIFIYFLLLDRLCAHPSGHNATTSKAEHIMSDPYHMTVILIVVSLLCLSLYKIAKVRFALQQHKKAECPS